MQPLLSWTKSLANWSDWPSKTDVWSSQSTTLQIVQNEHLSWAAIGFTFPMLDFTAKDWVPMSSSSPSSRTCTILSTRRSAFSDCPKSLSDVILFLIDWSHSFLLIYISSPCGLLHLQETSNGLNGFQKPVETQPFRQKWFIFYQALWIVTNIPCNYRLELARFSRHLLGLFLPLYASFFGFPEFSLKVSGNWRNLFGISEPIRVFFLRFPWLFSGIARVSRWILKESYEHPRYTANDLKIGRISKEPLNHLSSILSWIQNNHGTIPEIPTGIWNTSTPRNWLK